MNNVRQSSTDIDATKIVARLKFQSNRSNDSHAAGHTATSPNPVAALVGLDDSEARLKTCLVLLARLLEPTIGIADLRDSIPESESFDIDAFVNCMAHLGYSVKKLELTPADVDSRLLPCIFIPKRNSRGLPPEPFIISADPAAAGNPSHKGIVRTVEDLGDASSHTGTAFLFKKQNADDYELGKSRRRQTNRSWFRSILARFKSTVWQLALIGVMVNTMALATPLFIMVIYDRVISPQNTDFMPMLVAGIAMALLFEMLLRSLRSRLVSWLTARIHFIIGTEVFKQLISLPPAAIHKTSPTAQLARFKSIESIRDFLGGPIFISTIEIPTVFIAVAVLVFFSPILAAIPIISSLLFAALFFGLRHFVADTIKAAATESSIAQKFSIETFQCREEIRTNGLADVWSSKFRNISGRENHAHARLQFLGLVGESLGYALGVLTAFAALMMGVELVWSNTITTGMLVASMILIWRSIAPFYSLCSVVPRFEQARNSILQINTLMEVETEEEQRRASAKLPSLQGAVDFNNVTLRYARDAGPVFVGLRTNIAPGQIVAITGATGSGKSSVLKLVQSIAQPQLGQVSLDGFNLQQLVALEVRRQIAYVPQTPSPFPGTIAENLRIAKPEASDNELWSVLAETGATEMVRSLPGDIHYDLTVGQSSDRLAELSHRVALARAFLQHAQVTLIDEIPGNLLNNGLDAVLTRIIEQHRGQRTLLFVTQRADHMRMADKVIGLRFGQTPLIGSLETITKAAT
ncbi:MAG: ATP-binding cassette domain-containing protein [Alphaproteobacteria bacterium]|nr:ATP-binding cassette domain-containing protein [Alphaproteobacteria bacterium]